MLVHFGFDRQTQSRTFGFRFLDFETGFSTRGSGGVNSFAKRIAYLSVPVFQFGLTVLRVQPFDRFKTVSNFDI